MVEKQELIWSPYQKKLFQEIQQGTGHLIVEARAGSAKSTSIIESFRYIPKGKKTIALAFNKIIQKELEARSPSYVQCLTFHSLGFRAIKQRFPNVELDDWKVFSILKELPECENNNDLIFNLCDTIAYCKYGLMDSPRDIDNLISLFGISVGELDRKDFIRIVIQTLGKDKEMASTKIDYNDMCYLPFVLNLELPIFDLVFIDERQDINASQKWLCRRVCKKGSGRIIAVGDKFQDLYSWRLSDQSLIQELEQDPNTKTLSLPISYRCPKKIIELVKPWVPDITCPETAKEGSIEEISLNKLYDTAKPGCFVLSRTNAPLIKICMSFIRNGVRANIRGRDVGKQLNAIIKRSKKKQVPAFLKWLDGWKKEECEKLAVKGMKTDNLLDRYECLTTLCDELKTLEEVKAKIEEMFDDTDESKMVICGTTHAVKGLERDVVFLLRWTYRAWFDNILPGVAEDGDEEMNIAYVACTRSKNKLYLVNKW